MGPLPHVTDKPVIIEVQPFSDGFEVLDLQVFAGKIQTEGRVVVYDYSVVTVENLAPRGDNGDGLDAVLLSA